MYDIKTNTWTVLDIQLKIKLSNAACFSPDENRIAILGGGYIGGNYINK